MNFYQRYTTLQATLYLHWCLQRSPIVTQKKTVLPKSTYYSFNQLNAAHAIFCELSAALTKSCNTERPLRMRSSYDLRKRYLRWRQFRQRKVLYHIKLAITENFKHFSPHASSIWAGQGWWQNWAQLWRWWPPFRCQLSSSVHVVHFVQHQRRLVPVKDPPWIAADVYNTPRAWVRVTPSGETYKNDDYWRLWSWQLKTVPLSTLDFSMTITGTPKSVNIRGSFSEWLSSMK